MSLIGVSRFRAEDGDGNLHDYKPGQEINVTPKVEAYLLRCSPASFKEAKVEVKVKPPTPDISAMSTKTATGIVAPDRRARGGNKRAKK